MFVTGLGTAVPAKRYTQRECWEALQQSPHYATLGAPGRALLDRVLLGEHGVRTRHLALDDLGEALEIDPDVLYRRFLVHAPELATRAAHTALQEAGLQPQDIDAVLISTCTGYLCPGLTSYVGERLGLRPDVLALDLVGQGCGAALPNLRTADALLRGSCEHVLSICVEVCSAALYVDNDPGVLVSACLFGDGAAAAVTSNHSSAEKRRVEWLGCVSHQEPAARDKLRMEVRHGLLRNTCRAKCRRSPASTRAACWRRDWNSTSSGAATSAPGSGTPAAARCSSACAARPGWKSATRAAAPSSSPASAT